MAKELVNSFMANRIYLANMNKNGMMSDSGRRDMTEEAVKAVFQHMNGEYKKKLKDDSEAEGITFSIEGFGSLRFEPEND